MKYCPKCGKELLDEALFCVDCGCPVDTQENQPLLNTLSQRLNTNGIIWLVIGILQIIGGIYIRWFLLVIGGLNIISSIQDMKYSKTVLEAPSGIVAKFEPLAAPIITLIYNLVAGGVIGVAGSIYYFVAIRSFVLSNKTYFERYDVKRGEVQ